MAKVRSRTINGLQSSRPTFVTGAKTVTSTRKGIVIRVFKDGYAYIEDPKEGRQFVAKFNSADSTSSMRTLYNKIRNGVAVRFTEKKGHVESFEVLP